MSQINTFLVDSDIVNSYDDTRDVFTDDEEEEEIEEYACTPRSKKVKFAEMDRRQGAKVRQIEKHVERTSREPGDRLGKNAKKAAGRRAYIDDIVNPDGDSDFQVPISESIPQKTYGQIRRKLGHRPAFFEN